MQPQKIRYPRLSRRIQALMIDSVVLPVAALTTLLSVAHFTENGLYSAIAAGVMVFMLEPFLVTATGGTIGHHLCGIRVSDKSSNKNINIVNAVLRLVTKLIFGLFSLITFFTTKKHQAIHDILTHSHVTLKNPQNFPLHEALKPRLIEDPNYNYPAKSIRLFLIATYNLLFFLLVDTVSAWLVLAPCLDNSYCSLIKSVLSLAVELFWLAGVAAIIILCWNGKLFGCRRQLKHQ